MKRELGDGLELDDDEARIDGAEVHRWLSEVSYWATGRPRCACPDYGHARVRTC